MQETLVIHTLGAEDRDVKTRSGFIFFLYKIQIVSFTWGRKLLMSPDYFNPINPTGYLCH